VQEEANALTDQQALIQVAVGLERAGLRASPELMARLVGPFQRTRQGLEALREQLSGECHPVARVPNPQDGANGSDG
jgi:hypothetical protein